MWDNWAYISSLKEIAWHFPSFLPMYVSVPINFSKINTILKFKHIFMGLHADFRGKELLLNIKMKNSENEHNIYHLICCISF